MSNRAVASAGTSISIAALASAKAAAGSRFARRTRARFSRHAACVSSAGGEAKALGVVA